MAWRILFLVFIVGLLSTCDKDIVDIELSPLDKQRPVMEGALSDNLEKQVFTCTWTQKLGTTNSVSASGFNLQVHTPFGIQMFNEIGPGTYQSMNAFKGEYGNSYTIDFEKDGIHHQREIKMPEPIELLNAKYEQFDSTSTYSSPMSVGFYLTSPSDQYLRYTLYSGTIFDVDSDTIWNELTLPIYSVTEVPAGDSVLVSLTLDNNNLYHVYYNFLLKIELEVVTTEVGEYLLELKEYSTNNTKEGKAINPPYYYSNEAYGLGYGSISYAIIHQY